MFAFISGRQDISLIDVIMPLSFMLLASFFTKKQCSSILSYHLTLYFFVAISSITLFEGLIWLLEEHDRLMMIGLLVPLSMAFFYSSTSMLPLMPKLVLAGFPIAYYLGRTGLIKKIVA